MNASLPAGLSTGMSIVALLTACAAGVSAPSNAPSKTASAVAQAPERDHIKLTYATAGGAQSFTRLAADKGFYQKYGVTVDVQYAQSNVSMAALTAGEVQLDVTAGPDVIQAVTSGAGIKIVGYFDKHSPYGVFATPDLKEPNDLRGKTVAIGKIGDTSDISLRMALKPYGLDATKDLKLLQVGNSPDRWAALSSHQVQAAIIDEDSFVKQAESQGFKVLISLKKTPYAATVLAAQDAFLKQNPNTTLAALRGLSDSVRFFNDDRNKADVMAVIGRELRLPVSDPQVEASWEAIHARLDPDPYPDKQGVQVVLDALKDVDAGRYSALTADQLIDASFAEKLRAS